MAARMICAVQARYLNPILGHTPQRLPTSRLRRAAGWKFGNMFSPLDLRASSTDTCSWRVTFDYHFITNPA
jgi:hypothetical protein